MNVRRTAIAVIAVAATMQPAHASAPVPVPYTAYDTWNSVSQMVYSDDGAMLAYVVTPQDANPTLIVRNMADGTEHTAARASAPAFVGDSFVVFTELPERKAIDKAKNEELPASKQPKNGLGIMDLRPGGATTVVENIKTIVTPTDGGDTIAYLAEPSPSPSAPAPAPTISPSASPTPMLADKAKASTSTLTIRKLGPTAPMTQADVTEVVEAADGSAIAFVTQTKDGRDDGVHVYFPQDGRVAIVASGAGRYRKLAISRDGVHVAYLSDAATYAQPVPHDALCIAGIRAATISPACLPDGDAAHAPSPNGAITFSEDGARVFFGTAAQPTPIPQHTPRPFKVDIWSYNDDVLQSAQRHDADRMRKRTDLAVYSIASQRVAQLGSSAFERVVTTENAQYALVLDSKPYSKSTSWIGRDRYDLYAASLTGGTRHLIARDVEAPSLSPGGAYALAWDEAARHWFTYPTNGDRPKMLGMNAHVSFALENDDHPAPPPPYGSGGWLAGDRGVMIYDRYDVWMADPQTGRATNLTAGAGRRTHTVFSPVQPDKRAHAFDPHQPLLLSLIDERTYASGYARVSAAGGTPVTLLRADERIYGMREPFSGGLHDMGLAPEASRDGSMYAFTRETFRSLELWSANASFAKLTQLTHLNPQQAQYRWGTERMITFPSADGTPLRAIMLVPDGLARNRKAPMLVYFYETWSPYYHTYYAPGPGTSPNFARYVSHGYVVLLPDVHYVAGHPGKSALHSILPAVDAAVRTGYVDPSRVGIAGHSWAAYQINYMITQTHRFRAVEAGAAVDDMISAYGGIRLESGAVREGQYEQGQSRIGAPPWDRPDLYVENSGIFGIKNVTTPYLTVHNDGDTAVPQFQGIEFITAMRRLNKIAYLFSFDGEEHGITKRENAKYWTVHLDEWFDYWLARGARPSWFDGIDYLQRGERNVDAIYGDGP
jgi:dipeptidyl aminopeptidase/acylaminoacyl peptidase